MESIYTNLINSVTIFILVFIRMSGMFVIAPIFGRKNLPTYFKLGFAFFISLILVNNVSVPNMDGLDNIFSFTAVVARELIVGITIGYVANMVFSAIYLAGTFIDMQIGFGMVNVVDPTSNMQVAITSQFYLISTMLIFLSYGGHHLLITAVFESYNFIPINGAIFSKILMGDILKMFGNLFIVAFKIAAPITGAILLVDVAIGIVAKTVPQFNIFVVGLPLKILIGLIVLVISMPMFNGISNFLFRQMDSEMYNIIRHMGGAE